ncbi:MAG: zinc ABC transporter substrate-binding protein, partial [Chloroflexota bacterium]|nr:zinc ABC transporter substrate-binding protein [Chloroflexota bacterium]
MKVHLETLVSMLCILVLTGCGGAATQPVEPTTTLNIVVSIVPQQYFVERIGGEHVNVTVMVPPGFSPATYEPKPEQLQV